MTEQEQQKLAKRLNEWGDRVKETQAELKAWQEISKELDKLIKEL